MESLGIGHSPLVVIPITLHVAKNSLEYQTTVGSNGKDWESVDSFQRLAAGLSTER